MSCDVLVVGSVVTGELDGTMVGVLVLGFSVDGCLLGLAVLARTVGDLVGVLVGTGTGSLSLLIKTTSSKAWNASIVEPVAASSDMSRCLNLARPPVPPLKPRDT